MILLEDLLSEKAFAIYQTHIRVTHNPDVNVQDIGNMLRAVPGVVTIVQVDHDYEARQAILKAKILTTKPVGEAWKTFVSNSKKVVPVIDKIEVDYKGIEKKG